MRSECCFLYRSLCMQREKVILKQKQMNRAAEIPIYHRVKKKKKEIRKTQSIHAKEKQTWDEAWINKNFNSHLMIPKRRHYRFAFTCSTHDRIHLAAVDFKCITTPALPLSSPPDRSAQYGILLQHWIRGPDRQMLAAGNHRKEGTHTKHSCQRLGCLLGIRGFSQWSL